MQSEPVYHDETHLQWLFTLPDFMPSTIISRAFKWKTAEDNCKEYFGCGGAGSHVCSCEVGQRYCEEITPYVVERKYLVKADADGKGTIRTQVSHH